MVNILLRRVSWILLLLVVLCIEIGCAVKLSPTSKYGSSSPTASVVTAQTATSQLVQARSTYTTQPTLTSTRPVLPTYTQMPTPAPSVTPSQTPSPIPSPTPQPTSPPPTLENIRVFFSTVVSEYAQRRNADELKKTTEIWEMLADGSDKLKLFTERLEGEWNSSLGHLTLSHSGHSLAFVRFVDKRATATWSSSLWVMSVDGSNLRELVSRGDTTPGSPNWSEEDEITFSAKERPMYPVWSPDDSLIAFVDWLTFSQGESGRVHILDVASGQSQMLGEGETCAWSPDGSALAIYSERLFSSTHSLRIVNLKGEVVSAVALPPSIFLKSLHWSTSAGLIVAQGADYEKQMYPILIVDPDRDTVEEVVDDGHNTRGFGPQWSPDGKMISFGHTVEGSTSLYILGLNTRIVRLAMPQVGSQAVWSPDSMYILVQSEVEGNGLYIVSASNGQYWKISNLGDAGEDVWFSSYDWLFTTQ